MATVHITFLGMTRSAAVEAQVQRWVDRLERSFGRLLRSEVWIEQPHQHNRKGKTFRVRVELAVPGTMLVVSRDTADHAHENVYVALSDAFRAARRQLQTHVGVRTAQRVPAIERDAR
jgi:ribosome-associated translation inhibitor RaiA